MTIESSAPGGIYSAISSVMKEVGGVAKGRKNQAQNYTFRGIADLYLACQPLMAKHGIFFTPHAVLHEEVFERKTKSDSLQMHIRQRIEFRFYHTDGSYFSTVTTGEAMDTGDKASNKCMSAAAKYALIITFAIPEEDPEIDIECSSPEATHNEVFDVPNPIELQRLIDAGAVKNVSGVGAKYEHAHRSQSPVEQKPVEMAAAVGLASTIFRGSGQSPTFPLKTATHVQVAFWSPKTTTWDIAGDMESLRSSDQNKALHAMKASNGLTDVSWRKGLERHFNKTTSADLSQREASELIDMLRNKSQMETK